MDCSILQGNTDMLDTATDGSGARSKKKDSKVPRGAPKSKKERASRPRQPARPHRKLGDDTLAMRIKDLHKKLSVLKSRIVLLDDRLDTYKREDDMRNKSTDVHD